MAELALAADYVNSSYLLSALLGQFLPTYSLFSIADCDISYQPMPLNDRISHLDCRFQDFLTTYAFDGRISHHC
jgi:hypothetical protein